MQTYHGIQYTYRNKIENGGGEVKVGGRMEEGRGKVEGSLVVNNLYYINYIGNIKKLIIFKEKI